MLKLSAQLDDTGNPNLVFELYRSYVQHNKRRIPQSALDVIDHPDWSGGSMSKAPYYSQLIGVQLEDVGKPTASLKLLLQKDMYVDPPFQIEITYSGVFSLDIPHQNMLSEAQLIWRYEQFLCFNAYPAHQIKDKFFKHQIEWTDGVIWSVTAREVEVQWK